MGFVLTITRMYSFFRMAVILACVVGVRCPVVGVEDDSALLAAVGLEHLPSPTLTSIPPGALRIIGQRALGHPDNVMDIDVSPDGRWVVMSGQDGRVVLLDRIANQEIARWQGIGWFSGVAFCDNTHFVVFSDRGWLCRFTVTDPHLYAVERVLRDDERAYYVAVSADGRTCAWLDPTKPYPFPLVLSCGGTRRTFPGSTYAFRSTPSGPPGDSNVYGLEFSPNSQEIALLVGNTPTVVTVNATTGEWVHQMHVPELGTGPCFGVAWLDADHVVMETAGSLGVVDPRSGHLLARRPITESLAGIAIDRSISQRPSVLFCHDWQDLGVWPLQGAMTGKRDEALAGSPTGRQERFFWMSEDEHTITCIHGLDFEERALATGALLTKTTLAVHMLGRSRDGESVLIRDDDYATSVIATTHIKAAHPETLTLAHPKDDSVSPAHFASAPRTVCASLRSGAVAFYSTVSGAEVSRLPQIPEQIYAEDSGPDGLLAAGGEEFLLIWRGATVLHRIPLPKRRLLSIVIGNQGRLVATADQPVPSAHATSYQAACSLSGVVRLWEVSTGEQVGSWEIGPVGALCFSADDRYLVAGGGARLLIYDHVTKRSLMQLEYADIDRLVVGATVIVSGTRDGCCTVWPLVVP